MFVDNKFSYDLPARIKNMEDFIKLLEEEKSETINRIAGFQNHQSLDKSVNHTLDIILLKKRLVEIIQEITSKNEFISKLRSKKKIDSKEFEKNLHEANLAYDGIVKAASSFLDEDEEKNNNMVSWAGNMVQYQMNSLILSKEKKDDGLIVFWYNALKKELGMLKEKEKRDQEKKDAEVKDPELKINAE